MSQKEDVKKILRFEVTKNDDLFRKINEEGKTSFSSNSAKSFGSTQCSQNISQRTTTISSAEKMMEEISAENLSKRNAVVDQASPHHAHPEAYCGSNNPANHIATQPPKGYYMVHQEHPQAFSSQFQSFPPQQIPGFPPQHFQLNLGMQPQGFMNPSQTIHAFVSPPQQHQQVFNPAHNLPSFVSPQHHTHGFTGGIQVPGFANAMFQAQNFGGAPMTQVFSEPIRPQMTNGQQLVANNGQQVGLTPSMKAFHGDDMMIRAGLTMKPLQRLPTNSPTYEELPEANCQVPIGSTSTVIPSHSINPYRTPLLKSGGIISNPETPSLFNNHYFVPPPQQQNMNSASMSHCSFEFTPNTGSQATTPFFSPIQTGYFQSNPTPGCPQGPFLSQFARASTLSGAFSPQGNQIPKHLALNEYQKLRHEESYDYSSGLEAVSTNDTPKNSCKEDTTAISNVARVGKYSPLERKSKIRRYKQKLLNFREKNPLIKGYVDRKAVAMAKPRVKGKFVKAIAMDVEVNDAKSKELDH